MGVLALLGSRRFISWPPRKRLSRGGVLEVLCTRPIVMVMVLLQGVYMRAVGIVKLKGVVLPPSWPRAAAEERALRRLRLLVCNPTTE